MSDQEQPPKRTTPSRYVPFLNRTQAMGSNGWEAYTIGFTLVGCIMAGAGLGWLLDNRFGTSYWLPILFLVGVIAGFREMLQTLNRISKNEARNRQVKAEREASNVYTPRSTETNVTSESVTRERLFSVPPPPFESDGSPETKADALETDAPETTEEIIERLLKDADDDERDKQNSK